MTPMRDGYILLIEDNADDEELTLRALRKSKISNRVHVARDGAEAAGFLFTDEHTHSMRREGRPEFILLDLQLPGLSGIELLKQIRKEPTTSRLPVIVLSTSDEPSDIHESYRLGANSYVLKPVDFKAFVEVIGDLGVYWLSRNEPCPQDSSSRGSI